MATFYHCLFKLQNPITALKLLRDGHWNVLKMTCWVSTIYPLGSLYDTHFFVFFSRMKKYESMNFAEESGRMHCSIHHCTLIKKWKKIRNMKKIKEKNITRKREGTDGASEMHIICHFPNTSISERRRKSTSPHIPNIHFLDWLT